MTTATGLIADICAHPEDVGLRLILADHLEENGEADRSEFIRAQCELAMLMPNGVCPKCNSYGGPCDTCEFGPIDRLQRRERELLERKVTSRPNGDTGCAKGWSGGTQHAHWGIDTFKGLERTGLLYGKRLTWEFRCGFVEVVSCSKDDFLAHGPAIIVSTPIREVRITDVKPWLWGLREPLGWTLASKWDYPIEPRCVMPEEWCEFMPQEKTELCLPRKFVKVIARWDFANESTALSALGTATLRWARTKAGLP